jgi:act minimal PKS chain-length factor (CLF/KS beta)
MTVYVTGAGVIAPTGITLESYWEASVTGANAIDSLTRFSTERYPVKLAGEIRNFDEKAHIPSKLLPQTDQMTRYALYAADAAISDSALDWETLDPYEIGVFTAASGGAVEFGQRELGNLWARGKEFVSAYQSFAWFYAVNTGQISIKNGTKGPSGVVLSENAGGLDAIGLASRKIAAGLPYALAGGVDSALSPWGFVPQMVTGRMSESTSPGHAFQPFGTAASGYVSGEGGAMIMLQSEMPDTRPYAAITGYASSFDRAENPQGRRLSAAIRAALVQSGLEPADIGAIFADGSAVPAEDTDEVAAIAEVFGSQNPPVVAAKAGCGRLLAGSAALDVVLACLSMTHDVLPPTPLQYDVVPGIDLVMGEAREVKLAHVLVLARGFGGFNSALILSKTDTDRN